MAGLGVRLYTDEMLSARIAQALRRLGYEVVSCHEVGRGGLAIPDGDQLTYAAQDARAVLTSNIGDFIRLDRQWKSTARTHGGIILISHALSFGELIRCTARHLDTVPPDVQADTLLWLDTSDPA